MYLQVLSQWVLHMGSATSKAHVFSLFFLHQLLRGYVRRWRQRLWGT